MITVGIDEVGRGCWAGPLVAAAVILHQHIEGLDDSKKLSAMQRSRFDAMIHEVADVGVGWVTPQEVDELGLTDAVRTAMRRALVLLPNYDKVIIDGAYNFLPDVHNSHAVIRADGSIDCVSAASIVAKVARDRYMQTQAELEFPEYGFAKHVGYGTAMHIQSLQKYGVTSLHRKSYKPIQRLISDV